MNEMTTDRWDYILRDNLIQARIAGGYCPKCGSRLYPDDELAMQYAGVCGSCVSWDRTPDRRYQAAYDAGIAAEKASKGKGKKGGKR